MMLIPAPPPLAALVLLPCLVQSQEKFLEDALARGVAYTVQQPDTFGSGLAFADLDQDGDPDLVTVGRMTAPPGGTTIGLFENDGAGYFTDRAGGSGIPPLPNAAGVSAADVDGDGDLDLFFSCWLAENRLFVNLGGFRFADATIPAGMAGFDGPGQGAAWGDYDGDGWLDLYVVNRTGTNYPDPPFDPTTQRNRLLHNLGGTGFEELAGPLGVDAANDPSFQPVFFDYDKDGDADLYLANDKGAVSACGFRNRMWVNLGGVFADAGAASGTDGCIDAMGVAVGDLDGNGWPDLYVSNTPAGNPLYLNNGDGTFTESSAVYGVESHLVGWGTSFFDWDNDGWLDIYLCQHMNPNRLYDFDGTPPAADIAALVDADDPNQSFASALADVDDDGDLDIAVANRFDRVRLYINREGSQRSWAKFRVAGEGANTFGVGTRIEVRAGAVWRLREVIAGSNFKSQDDLTVHFGLGLSPRLDEVAVTWPGGTARTLTDYAIKQTWTLYPPARLGDASGDGVVDVADYVVLASCFGRPVAPGCEMMDMNGDAIVDSADLPAFLARFSGPQGDCNGNGVGDLEDILTGGSLDLNLNAVPDECEILLSGPFPGTTGGVNTLTVSNASPGLRVFFAYGRAAGSAGLAGCPGLTVGLEAPVVLGAVTADAGGAAVHAFNVPNKAAGRTIRFQAAQPGACRVSNLVVWTFP